MNPTPEQVLAWIRGVKGEYYPCKPDPLESNIKLATLAAQWGASEQIKALSAGVSVEYDGYDPRSDQYLYTLDQLNAAIAAARVQENERCLAMMDAIGCDWRDAGDMAKFYATNYLREAIRALLGKEAQS